MDDSSLILESVRERDIDLLFLEEWNVNKEFCEWFIKTMCGRVIGISLNKAFHSIAADNLGETDIFLSYCEKDTESIILVENKIDAIAQVEQGSRYRKRASNLMSSGKYSCVNTCIIAPKEYLKRDKEAQEYEYQISYEKLIDWFSNFNDARNKYKALILKYAVEQERRGYTVKADPHVTKFWHDYWEQLKLKIPHIYMKEPYGIPAGSDWPSIAFEWMPNKWILRHKLAMGVIDLETKLNDEEAKKVINKCSDIGFSIYKTGKSISLRLNVKQMDRNTSIFSQYEMFESAINALKIFDNSKDEILSGIK